MNQDISSNEEGLPKGLKYSILRVLVEYPLVYQLACADAGHTRLHPATARKSRGLAQSTGSHEMKIEEALITLRVLQSQLNEQGIANVEYEEICISQDAIRLRKDGKTLRIPLQQVATLKP